MLAVLLAVQVFAASGPLHVTPAAPGAPRFVQLETLAGLPADSSLRAEFYAGLRGVFATGQLASESRTDDGEWEHGVPVSNRFKLLEGSPADDAWGLRITLGSPPPLKLPARGEGPSHRATMSRRTSRGMIAAFELVPPADHLGAVPITVREAFAFPAEQLDAGAQLGVPATGYAFPWDDAGRVVGTLALEALHRATGDLRASERCDIAPALRQEAGR